MKKLLPLYLLLLAIPMGCIDSFSDPSLLTLKEGKLIVEGFITTNSEKFRVTLTKSRAALDRENPSVVINAKVKIIDNLKNEYELPHTRQGIYLTTENQQVIVGRSYKVVIEFSDGKKYESTPELVRSAPPIDSVKYQFVEATDFQGYKKPYFEVTGEMQDDAKSKDYYRWDWTHYQYLSYCENNYNGISKILFRVPCCDDCWGPKKIYGDINFSDDYLFNGKKISQPLLSLPYNSKRPYYMDVRLYSVSKEYSQFWKLVKAQINNVPGVFDNPPATIQGNIKNVNDPDEQVLGFFGAAASSEKQIYVLRSKAPYPPVIQQLSGRVILVKDCTPCKEGDFRTNFKPKNWNDDYNTLFYDPMVEF